MALEITVYPPSFETRDEAGDYVRADGIPYTVAVRSIYPTESTEPDAANRNSLTDTYSVLTDEAVTVDPRAEIDLFGDGTRWQVTGRPMRWDATSNPVRRLGFRYATAPPPSLNVGCVEIRVRKVDG